MEKYYRSSFDRYSALRRVLGTFANLAGGGIQKLIPLDGVFRRGQHIVQWLMMCIEHHIKTIVQHSLSLWAGRVDAVTA